MRVMHKIYSALFFILSNFKYFNFSSPKKNKLLIADTITLDHLKKYVLFDINFIAISTRVTNSKAVKHNDKNSSYYLSFKIIFFFFKGLQKKLNFRTSYIYACINCVKPKVILHPTHDYNFIRLAKILPKINFIILCHGSWYDINEDAKKFDVKLMIHDLAKINVGEINNFYIIVNGNKDVDLFKEIINKNNQGIQYLAFGSTEASYNSSLNYPKDITNDILFVSQIFDAFFSSDKKMHKQILNDTSDALKMLLRYCGKNNLTLSYLCREKNGSDIKEIDFVKSISQNLNIKFIKNTDSPLWKEIYSSKIVATIDSTAGFDSISVKKKTLIMMMSFMDGRKYQANSFFGDFKKIWRWTIKDNNYLNFKSLLDELIILNQSDYEVKTKRMRDYWFYTSTLNPAYLKIKNFLNQKINE